MSVVNKVTSKHYRICVISDYFVKQYREQIRGSYFKVYPVFVTSDIYHDITLQSTVIFRKVQVKYLTTSSDIPTSYMLVNTRKRKINK